MLNFYIPKESHLQLLQISNAKFSVEIEFLLWVVFQLIRPYFFCFIDMFYWKRIYVPPSYGVIQTYSACTFFHLGLGRMMNFSLVVLKIKIENADVNRKFSFRLFQKEALNRVARFPINLELP